MIYKIIYLMSETEYNRMNQFIKRFTIFQIFFSFTNSVLLFTYFDILYYYYIHKYLLTH